MLWDHRPGQNRFAGIVLQEYSAGAAPAGRQRGTNIFAGHGARAHRSAAPVQARRLLLPADGRGRHRLGPRRHDGALAGADRARTSCILTARCLERASSPGRAAAARGPRRPGGDAGRRDLHGVPVRPAAAEPGPLHAGPRDRDPDRWRGRPTAGCARRTATACRRSRSPAPRRSRRTPSPRRRCARTSTTPQLPIDFQWLRSPWPDELFSLTRAARATCGSTAAKRSAACSRRRWSPGGSRRTASAPRRARVRAGALPADGRPRLLLQQRQVPLPLRVARRARQDSHLRVMSCPAGPRVADAFTPPIPLPPTGPVAAACRGGLRAAALRVSDATGEPWQWLPQMLRRQHPLGRGQRAGTARTSPARSSAWPARTWRAPRCAADFDWFEYRERGLQHRSGGRTHSLTAARGRPVRDPRCPMPDVHKQWATVGTNGPFDP